MLLGSLAFAVMAFLAHQLGPYCDWQIIVFVRTFVAMCLAAALAWLAGARLVLWRPPVLWLRSIAGGISLLCTFYAYTRLPVSDVLTLINMFPIWVALLSWPLFGEAPSARLLLAAGSALAGVVLIQRPHLSEGNFAALLALLSSFTTALAMIGLHRLGDIDPRAIVVHFSAVGTLFCFASFFFFERTAYNDHLFESSTILMLAAVGVLATIGQLFLTKAFADGIPARVAVVSLSQVVFALVLDVVFAGRSFDGLSLLGIALVVIPTGWVMSHPRG
jgi:drug/metabolite transporter (DMT)-like permease